MKSLLARIYTFFFLNHFVLIYPLYAVMFTDHGLSAAEVASILAVWSGVVFLLEIPSGVLADKFSRRKILFWAMMVRAIGYGVWLFFPNYWGFLVGFLCWGIKSALSHGTFEALVFDELKAEGEEGQYTRVMSRVRALAFLAVVMASVGASGTIFLGYKFVLVLSIVSNLGAAFFALALPSAPRTRDADKPAKRYIELLRLGIANAWSDPVVLRIVVFMAVTGGFLGTLDEFWPIFADMSGAPKWGIPLFVGVLSSVQGLASFYAHRFDGFGDQVFYAAFVVSGIFLMVAAAIMSLWVLGLLVLVSALDAVVKVVFDARLQHRIGSETRATISSVRGLLTELFGLAGLGAFGFVSAWKGAQTSFEFMGLLIALAGLAYLFISWRKASRGQE